MSSTSASGKIILFGEHAVVYGHPALAIPLHQIRARAVVETASGGNGCRIFSNLYSSPVLLEPDEEHPLVVTVRLVLEQIDIQDPDLDIFLRSDIPVASGLGSGAAVSAAVARAIFSHFGVTVSAADVSAIVFETEKLHHGTPSGIDNTVICYEQPVYFVRGQAPQIFEVGQPFNIVIGDTGSPAQTKLTVGYVRKQWKARTDQYEDLFKRIGQIVDKARITIESGDLGELGSLMIENHQCLKEMGVSTPELDHLVQSARAHGAYGAKLSGGGGGGNMIALVAEDKVNDVVSALYSAGAKNVLSTEVKPS